MGLLPLNHFDDPPQLSLQVVLLALKRIMCLRLSRTQGLSHTRTHTRTHCISDTASDSLGNSQEERGTTLTKWSP